MRFPDISGYVAFERLMYSDLNLMSGVFSKSIHPSSSFKFEWPSGIGAEVASEKIVFYASGGNSIYGASTRVQPSAVLTLPCIKS